MNYFKILFIKINFGTEAEPIFQGCVQDPLLGWKQPSLCLFRQLNYYSSLIMIHSSIYIIAYILSYII